MNSQRLPSLPGLSLEVRFRKNHHVPQSFYYQNGYRIDRKPAVAIGKEPLEETYKEFYSEPIDYDPSLTYGRTKKQQVQPFRPHFVIYDKKTLKFMGYFRQHVPDSRTEHYRVRYVNIFYFLEDDTVEVIEPYVKNCGLSQGKLLRRSKIAKNASLGTSFYSWKDFNIGIDIDLLGIRYRIADCDKFTREFLASNGVEVKEKECMPTDPNTIDKIIQQTRHQQVSRKKPKDDKLRRFLEYFGITLSFDCVLDETARPGDGDLITFKLFYNVEDDTVTIKELPENQQGRDGFKLLLKRTKLPKNWKKKPLDFASIIFDTSDADVEEFYEMKDFMIGSTIFVFGKKFLLLDCDKFTRDFFDKVLRMPQPSKLEIERPPIPDVKIKLPTYLGLGTPEDSLSSCFNLMPKAPKKDVITYLMNANKILRYGCVLDTRHPEEKDRKFILNYNLADGNISIVERTIPNSGIAGGKFLSYRRIIKPNTNKDKPDYYGPKDFVIGSKLLIFSHRFIITSADLYVYRYMQAHTQMFSLEAIESVRMYNLREGNLKDDLRKAIEDDQQKYKNDCAAAVIPSNREEVCDPAREDRVPKPYIGEEEVKHFYHERQQRAPNYMSEELSLPCNIKVKEEENIPSEKGVVRFLESHEE